MGSWGYVTLCLLLPVTWGIISAQLFDWLQARRRGQKPSPETAGDDEEMYYI